jgi:UbiD family decarboxylase
MRLPVDELGIVASLRDAPLAVVKSITNDIRVPADAEYVIEGYLDEKGHREAEGPYGEFLGYYGAVKRNPVFHVTAITHRKDALFQTSTIGGKTLGRTDTAQLSALRTEVAIWHALQAVRSMSASLSASGCQGRRATPSAPVWARSPIARTCSWSTPTSTFSLTSRWIGRWRHAFSPTAI